MSIINQVLADLGQRKSGQPLPANGVLIGTVLAASLPAPRYTQYLPFGAAVVAVIVGVVLLWPSSGYDYTAGLTNSYETNSSISYAIDGPQNASLRLAPQLSAIDEENKSELPSTLILEEPYKQPVTYIEKSAPASSFSRQRTDILIKDVSGLVPGDKQQVRLLLSGNVGLTQNNGSLPAKTKMQNTYAASQLGYIPVLALDPNMAPAVNRTAPPTKNLPAKRYQTSIEAHPAVSSKQRVQVQETASNIQLERQAKQENSIRTITNAQRAEQIYQHALDLNAKGNLYQAMDELKEALTLNTNHLKARYTFAALLINTNQSDAALQQLTIGMNIQSDYAPFAKLYGRLMMDRGELDDAINVMEKARNDAQMDAEYYAQLAAIYQQKGMHPEAIAYYKQALRWQPTVGVWWMGLGISLEQQKQKRDAVTAYQKANATGTLSDDVLGYVQSRIKSLEMWK